MMNCLHVRGSSEYLDGGGRFGQEAQTEQEEVLTLTLLDVIISSTVCVDRLFVQGISVLMPWTLCHKCTLLSLIANKNETMIQVSYKLI